MVCFWHAVTEDAKTREQILFEAACLFNVKGYSGAALSDMMHATGLEKGGIYNHFESKEKTRRRSIRLFGFSHSGAFQAGSGGRLGATDFAVLSESRGQGASLLNGMTAKRDSDRPPRV
jgi:AcrR family transcriptional regulator